METKSKRILLITGILAFLVALLAGFLITKNISESKTPGWHESNGVKASYVLPDGTPATGVQEIDDKLYIFNEEGDLVRSKGWIDENGNPVKNAGTYYSDGDGELVTGWKYMDGKVWYFYQEEEADEAHPVGALARNYTTSGKIHIPAAGCVSGDRGLALAYGIDVLNKYGWTLESAYKYASSLRFVAGSDDHYGFTIHSCALQGFKYGKGNCLVWSSTFCVMARLLGYDCREIWGTLQWKGTRPHAWTEIWEEGDESDEDLQVFDPRKHDGEDMAGFDVQYGEKGSYKYDLDSREYLNW